MKTIKHRLNINPHDELFGKCDYDKVSMLFKSIPSKPTKNILSIRLCMEVDVESEE